MIDGSRELLVEVTTYFLFDDRFHRAGEKTQFNFYVYIAIIGTDAAVDATAFEIHHTIRCATARQAEFPAQLVGSALNSELRFLLTATMRSADVDLGHQ